MGTRNKERRRAKKKDRNGAHGRFGRTGDGRPNPTADSRFGASAADRPNPTATEPSQPRPAGPSLERITTLVLAAAHSGCEGRDGAPLLAELTRREAGSQWCNAVTAIVSRVLTEHATLALHGGWEPLDISAVLRRRVTAAAASLAEAVLPEASRRRCPDAALARRWEGQLGDLAASARALDVGSPAWGSDVAVAVEAIGFLGHLGRLPDLGSPGPGEAAHPGLDPALLDKVRGLLAKAEATMFEEEADAFLSKAQELMARHNLDRAAVQAGARDASPGIQARRCWLDDPYLKYKGYLLAVVAGANRCRSVSLYDYGFVTLFGHPDDLTTTEMLFTALLVHATNQMTLPLRSPHGSGSALGKGSSSLGPAPTAEEAQAPASLLSMAKRRASRPSYRRSFLVAYADRIGARLREVTSVATEAAVESSGEALLPVLASRERGVEDAMHKMFPETTTSELSVTDSSGWAAGRAAADMAELSWQEKLVATPAR